MLLTEAEVRSLERDNLLATLQAAKWKVRGPVGAAELLGVKPTTLYSRMQKLGIKPPESQDLIVVRAAFQPHYTFFDRVTGGQYEHGEHGCFEPRRAILSELGCRPAPTASSDHQVEALGA